MGNVPYELQHVASVEQRSDNTLVAYVQTDSFKPGQEVEVSVYLTQGNDYYASFNGKKHIPDPDPSNPNQPAVLPVELPRTELNPAQEVTVVTRVTEVWPTVLQQDSIGRMGGELGKEPKAVWTYQEGQGPGT